MIHEHDCIDAADHWEHECPEMKTIHARRQILRSRVQLQQVFLEPRLAAGHDLMKDKKLVYGHQ